MSNWRLHLKRLFQRQFQALGRFLARILRRFQGSEKPDRQLAKTCETLQRQLATPQETEKAWTTYAKALSLARKCNPTELTRVVSSFDPLFRESGSSSELPVQQAISFLLEAKPQTPQMLDAAWRLSQRLHEMDSLRDAQQQICLQLAQIGDSDLLLSKLLKRRNQNLLTSEDLGQILHRFLDYHSFQPIAPWKAFLEQFRLDELPQIHPVYGILERYIEAAELAEAAGDYRSAIHYLSFLAGKEIACRILVLFNRLGDRTAIAQAHQKVAEAFWQEGDYSQALEHFQAADNLERVSDCYQKLGNLGLAIQCRPSIHGEWVQEMRRILEHTVRTQMDSGDFLASVRLLKSVTAAWQESAEMAEAERTRHLLTEAVRTARAAFTSELRLSEGQTTTDLLKRWSLLEEAAGNYLEAGLQAEKAHDYFAASVLFEKAGAFGQALVALESASPHAPDPRKKAQLLEQGGDYFMAGLLYERLGDIEPAISMYEQATEFLRAAELRRYQLGDEQAVFDDWFQELLIKAGQIEQLAELCIARATEPECSSEQKARLWRRVKELGERGLVGQRWLDRVANELPAIEALDRRRFEEHAASWSQAACREVLAAYTDAIGLDLGTSNSVVALYNKQQGEPEVVERSGRRQFPSVFAIDQSGRERVGVPISELLTRSPRAIMVRAKREMGTDRKFKAGGQEYRAEEISARIINHARQLAREYLQKKISARILAIATRTIRSTPPIDWVNEFLEQHPPAIPLTNIVITVPAYFNEAQKQATKTAGVLADMNILRLIHEPTAACLAQRIRKDNEETILVADLGAGTFDLSIIQVGQGIFEVQEIEGDNALGSADLDELILAHFEQSIKAETGQEIPRNSQAGTRLRQACEELKIELSTQQTWTIDLPYLVGDRTIQLTLTRTELEHLAVPWLERIRETCQRIQAKPSRILLIGGGGLMPAVHRCIKNVFNLEPVSAYDPLTAVARGAALQAAILMGDLEETLLLDVVPFSLGIKCRVASGEFKFDSVIPRHTTIPTGRTQRYTTIEDNQTQVRIEIYQGESPDPQENFKIGEFILQGIPVAKAGVPQIDVEFNIDTSCLLTVTARDAATGNQRSIQIADSHLLTPAQTASFQTRFRNSQTYQNSLSRLEKLTAKLKTILHEVDKVNLPGVAERFHDRIQTYERYRERYSPTEVDNHALFEIYRDRNPLQDRTRLVLDQWGTLSRSVRVWLDQYGSTDWRSMNIENQVQQLLDEGNQLLQRTQNVRTNITEMVTRYQKWLSVIENLPVNPSGDAEDLARYFLSLNRYSEARMQFQRIAGSLSLAQIELGLEIFARSRQREPYTALLLEQAERLGVHRPDFENLNHAVRIYAASVVWIHLNLAGLTASGSGFLIGPNQIATNRHVLIDETTGKLAAPEAVRVITREGSLGVVSIHLPDWGADDVAILTVEPTSGVIAPLRLGYSELVEVGERIMTIGFPSPESGEFEENLYCNTGLVNRIRSSQLCTERVLEVSIPLQGGISGAPILNQFGEVIGLLTFWTERKQALNSGQIRSERSFYAVPVELLHRLRAKIQG
ncbi:Hsp70 family protein [Leptothermofonsia sichuanensis E412]|uniref:Hsp70 family protein n=1 Tax=Leptothermofonsia sichuanensis TaxID=2917832 RepID=UPI001CA6295E|nr:Hsp70 family protein [Leptothermofonsia sichuanensis]QZZ22136.1 Hsp70 family protein [Leptothermofonsia sichuanensis E412]